MSGLEQIVTAARLYEIGDLFKACTGGVCRDYIVRRIRRAQAGYVNYIEQVDGAPPVDPMLAHYDQLRRQKVERKEAARLSWIKFNSSESTFYRRLRNR